jgi:hypothetical protein
METQRTQRRWNITIALAEAEAYESPEEVKKRGLLNGLRRMLDDLEDENSSA